MILLHDRVSPRDFIEKHQIDKELFINYIHLMQYIFWFKHDLHEKAFAMTTGTISSTQSRQLIFFYSLDNLRRISLFVVHRKLSKYHVWRQYSQGMLFPPQHEVVRSINWLTHHPQSPGNSSIYYTQDDGYSLFGLQCLQLSDKIKNTQSFNDWFAYHFFPFLKWISRKDY